MDDRLGHLPAGKPNAAPPDSLVASAQVSRAAFLSPGAQLFFPARKFPVAGDGSRSLKHDWKLVNYTYIGFDLWTLMLLAANHRAREEQSLLDCSQATLLIERILKRRSTFETS